MRNDERIAGEEIDNRIEAALRSYAQPPATTEPRVALAQIMERTQVERPPARPVRWWKWSLAGTAACLVAAMVALWVMRTPEVPEIARLPQAPKAVAAPDHPAHAAIAEVQVSGNRRARHAGSPAAHREVAASTTTLAKLAVFPTPRPLTPEEQALVAFANHGPPEVQRAVLEDQKHWDDPVIVADLRNRSLRPGSQQDR
jgi:hypothetical protein